MRPMTTIRYVLCSLLLGVMPFAAAEPALPELPFGAALIEADGPRSGIHILPLGATRRAMSEWQLEDKKQINGQLWRQTWQLPRTTEAREFHQLMLDNWAERGARLLFHCKERSCGSSNHWANQVFGVKELYAPDDQQNFTALHWEQADARHYIALYSVERANRRRYSHLLWITADKAKDLPSAGVALTELTSGEPVFIPESLSQEQKAVWLDGLKALLLEQSGRQLVIVGHYYGEGALQAQQRQSKTLATEWASALQQAGVPEERVSAFGLGPLAQQPGTPRKNGVVLFVRER